MGIGEVQLSLACVDAIYTGVQGLSYLPGNLYKKMGLVSSTLTKIEGILYEMSLLSHGGISVRAPDPASAEDEEVDSAAGLSLTDSVASALDPSGNSSEYFGSGALAVAFC